MSQALPIPPDDPTTEVLADLVTRIGSALPAGGMAALPPDLSEAQLTQMLYEARELIDATPLDQRLAVKTALFEARHAFYLETMRDLPPADRHLKPFDTNNSGTLEFDEIRHHMHESFDKTPRAARKFTRMLFWLKMHRWRAVDISDCSRKAMHASGSGNWRDDGSIDEARYEENRTFLAGHAIPFSSVALDELVEHNTAAHRNPGARWIERRLGRRVSKREYGLAWRKAGITRDDGVMVITEPIYRMNTDGTLMAMLFNPHREAETIFRWHADGVLRHH